MGSLYENECIILVMLFETHMEFVLKLHNFYLCMFCRTLQKFKHSIDFFELCSQKHNTEHIHQQTHRLQQTSASKQNKNNKNNFKTKCPLAHG